jgi:hypothetical protein
VQQFIRIGVDLAKNYFQVHALTTDGRSAVKRKLRRSTMHEFFSRIERCRIGMEACGSAHYWARELVAMGHEVILMPPSYTKPYVKRGKNDAVDAEAKHVRLVKGREMFGRGVIKRPEGWRGIAAHGHDRPVDRSANGDQRLIRHGAQRVHGSQRPSRASLPARG